MYTAAKESQSVVEFAGACVEALVESALAVVSEELMSELQKR
jgi:hypothetical protein